MSIFSRCFESSSSRVQEIYIPTPNSKDFNPAKLISYPTLLSLVFIQNPQSFFTTVPLVCRKWNQIFLPTIESSFPLPIQFYLLKKKLTPKQLPKHNFQELDYLAHAIDQSIQKYPITGIETYGLRFKFLEDSINKDWSHLCDLFKLRTAPQHSWFNLFSCCINSHSAPKPNPYQKIQELYDKAIKIHQMTYSTIVQSRIDATKPQELLNYLTIKFENIKESYEDNQHELFITSHPMLQHRIREIVIPIPITYLPNFFCTLPLRELDCRGAKLNYLPDAIKGLTRLISLNLKGNDLPNVGLIPTLTTLRDLDISDNPCTSSPVLQEQARSQLVNLRLTSLNL